MTGLAKLAIPARGGIMDVRLQIEAFPPECSFETSSAMEFWITVKKPVLDMEGCEQ
jgi:hypothetical protein